MHCEKLRRGSTSAVCTQRMPSGGPVQLADPRADEARPATITMIAIAAAGLGLLFTLGLARVLPEDGPQPVHQVFPQAPQATASETSVGAAALPPAADEATEPPPRHPAAPETPRLAGGLATTGVAPAPKGPGDAPTAASPPATAGEKSPSSGLPADLPASTAPARTAPQQAPVANLATSALPHPAPTAEPGRAAVASKRRAKPIFEPGVVAYVRCEGLEQRGSRFPCPRDRKLEEHVWHALAQLADCTDPELGRGSAELRLTLAKSRTHAVDFRSSAVGPSLNLRALTKCAGGKLANARTSLKAPHAVVSFRFGLK